jgi:hypothetical protein
MDFLLGGVTKVINAMAAVLQGFSFTRDLGQDIAKISPYLQKANALLPIDAALTVLGLYITVQLALVAYYWITRTINLLRGAG